jgi:hypothetical protein
MGSLIFLCAGPELFNEIKDNGLNMSRRVTTLAVNRRWRQEPAGGELFDGNHAGGPAKVGLSESVEV